MVLGVFLLIMVFLYNWLEYIRAKLPEKFVIFYVGRIYLFNEYDLYSWSSRIEEQFKSTEGAIKLLANAEDPRARAQEMISAGIYPLACSFLSSKDMDLAVEAANLLIYILKTKINIEEVVIRTAAERLFKLLQSPLIFVVDKAAQAFAEIAGISQEYSKILLMELKILVPLLPLVKVKTTENVRH